MPRTTRKRQWKKIQNVEVKKAVAIHKLRNYGGPIFQRGGKVQCKTEYGIIEEEGFRFPYKCDIVDEQSLVIYGGQNSFTPCFGIFIYPDQKSAELQSFKRLMNCSLDRDATVHAAGKAAFKIAKEYGITHITLTDNARKPLPSGKKFSVSTMEFLSTGKSWYETFLPIQPAPEYEHWIEQWRQTVKTNTWNDVYHCLLNSYPNIVIPVPVNDIDTTAPGSAMLVFQRIKDARTEFFADYGEILPHCSNIGAIHGKDWVAHI